MRAKSASTAVVDPYCAGLSLGHVLSEVAPEIVFLFVTVHFDERPAFMAGLYGGLGDPAVRPITVSGDRAAADPEGAVRRALDKLARKLDGRRPALY